MPVEVVPSIKINDYIDFLMARRLHPKTINCHLECIRGFYDFIRYEENMNVSNPVRKGVTLRLPVPLPRYLKDEEVTLLFDAIKKRRDRAMFTLMLRCGLRVEEVANLTLGALDLRRRRLIVHNGKGRKDRVVYISDDAFLALKKYLLMRPRTEEKKIFLVEKGTCKGKGISVRGIQKRME